MNMEVIDNNRQKKTALFEAREPSASQDAGNSTAIFKGAERRRDHRRIQGDRRVEMRFDMDNPDRRVCQGRRAEDNTPKFW